MSDGGFKLVLGRTSIMLLILLGIFAAGASVSPLLLSTPVRAQGDEQSVYYGFVPREVWSLTWLSGLEEMRLSPQSVVTEGTVLIIGNDAGTQVRVYALPEMRLVRETTLNKLEKAEVVLPNGTFFKVASSKPATVVLMGGVGMQAGEAFTNTFFTSVTGSYVGKEFVFVALQGKTMPGEGPPYRVYALEDSEVTVTNPDGSAFTSFKLEANKYRELSFTALAVYRLASTGNVMLQSFYSADVTMFYPSVQGGFLGKVFYGSSAREEGWAPWSPPDITITSLQESRITVTDVGYRRKYSELTVAASSNVSTQVGASHVVFESGQPVMVMIVGSGSQFSSGGGGVAFTGLAAGHTALVYIPTNIPFTGEVPHTAGGIGLRGEAYIFTYRDTTVTVDDVQLRLGPDRVQPILGGFHRVSTDQNILIETVNWPDQAYSPLTHSSPRFADYGVCIPAVQSLSIVNDVQLKPVLGEEMPWTYIIAGVLIVAVVIIVLLTTRRRGKH